VGAALAPLPNRKRQKRTNMPACGTTTAGGGSGVGSGTGMGITGAAEAGKMLGTSGTSPCGFLSRLPIFESSMLG
jgi:hypothetical protein